VKPLDQILQRAREAPRRIAFPEATDPRVLRAARRLVSERIARPVLVGSEAAAREAAARLGLDLSGIPVVDPGVEPGRVELRGAVADALAEGEIVGRNVDALLQDPLYYAAAMVRSGVVDGSVAGAMRTTAETLRAALRIIRPAAGVRVVSSFFLIQLERPTEAGERVLAFADCGLVPEPSADELADIALRTAWSFRTLVGREPRVAFLSFSTKGSAHHPAAHRVAEAKDRLLGRGPDFPADGELQLDAALVPDVARVKAPGSPVAGAANVLIFPNLDAGNIAYKLVERLAGAQAVGPLIQGLSRPANDLSRGCSVDDVVVAAAVTALQAGQTNDAAPSQGDGGRGGQA
jgi:phosphate acetyltransferase